MKKINKIINRYKINKFQINKFQNNKMSDKVINIYKINKIINKHTIINQKINHNNIIVKKFLNSISYKFLFNSKIFN